MLHCSAQCSTLPCRRWFSSEDVPLLAQAGAAAGGDYRANVTAVMQVIKEQKSATSAPKNSTTQVVHRNQLLGTW